MKGISFNLEALKVDYVSVILKKHAENLRKRIFFLDKKYFLMDLDSFWTIDFQRTLFFNQFTFYLIGAQNFFSTVINLPYISTNVTFVVIFSACWRHHRLLHQHTIISYELILLDKTLHAFSENAGQLNIEIDLNPRKSHFYLVCHRTNELSVLWIFFLLCQLCIIRIMDY